MKRFLMIFVLIFCAPAFATEHGGKEHGGKPTQTTASSVKSYSASEIKAAMLQHIELQQKNGSGFLLIKDPKENNRELKLKFVKIHDPVRIIVGKGYFACTDFYADGNPAKLYDLDFWLNPKDGKLAVTDTKIHKEPQLVNGQWTKVARYTFVNDNPVEVK